MMTTFQAAWIVLP